jgi:hypothetical protein
VKSKNAFESSGNSPTKVSENGAPVLTGRGLEHVKRRIMESFEKIRLHKPAPAPPSLAEKIIYTEEHEVYFHARAKKLALVALGSPHITKAQSRGNVSEIVAPVESAEELIAEALRRFK